MIDPSAVFDEPPPPPNSGPIGRHLLPDTAVVTSAGRLEVGGVDIVSVAEESGTPVYIYDEATIRARCREARAAFGEGVAYATKAFLCRAAAEVVLDEGMNLDVSTGGELEFAIAGGAAPKRIVLHGNNKSDSELSSGFALGVGRIVVDSFDEVKRIERIAGGRRIQQLLVRVNPGIEAHTHQFVSTGQVDSKFGFSIASGAADEAIRTLQSIRGVDVVGVHAHIGSQILRLDSFERVIETLAPVVFEHGFGEMCVGGGVGVAYLTDETSPSMGDWAKVVIEACRRVGVPDSVRVTAEPGRAIVATAGMTCYRVGTIKQLQGVRTYVAIDGGMSDNPRPVLYGSGYETFLPHETDADRPFAARIVGKHCESGDIVVADARLPSDVAVGDIVATPVTGAYGYSMASNYNRVGRPPVVFVRDGGARTVVRRETTDDLLRLEP